MRVFRWLNDCEVTPHADLRGCGWHLLSGARLREDCVAIADTACMDALAWDRFLTIHAHESRRMILLLNVDQPDERARLLRLGFGEVLGGGLDLKELELRALRLTELENMLPRFRQIGRLRLDLLAREAFVHGEPLGLHPREFGLLWRLADEPGQPLSKRRLMKDVWHMRFVPETNSLAVHVSRLRTKMKAFGIAELLQTTRAGDYVLSAPERPSAEPGRVDEVG